MRILLVNPNTTEAMTRAVANYAAACCPQATFVPVTGRFGARYIASRAAAAIAAHAALEAVAEHADGMDAVYLACFGDPGLLALREVSPVPVVGLAEASCREACAMGRRFAIVTGGERWGPMLREFVQALGLADRLAAIRTVAPTGAAIARDPDAALDGLAREAAACVARDGAEVVILGGAGLAGLADRVAARVGAPVLCSVAAGARAAVAAARSSRAPLPAQEAPERGPAAESVGLPARLAALLPD